MSAPELAQLELLAQVDELVARLTDWVEAESAWEPMNRCRALVRRMLGRIERLRIRLEAPLVVAMFGGTGTGKSSLVNALIGRECSPAGRERPTTKRPILIAHPNTELELLGLPVEDFEIVRADAPSLRDIVIIDSPDPDTTEAEVPGSNLAQLHQLLPYCDVLIYTSTQQKYRSACVGEELGLAAAGCRLLFVQTHADLDEDIREDWRRQLESQYEVPEMFYVDSPRALREQAAGRRPSGDVARLGDLLQTSLAASQRIQVRRANLVDLVHAALEHCRSWVDEQRPAVAELEAVLAQERKKLTDSMAEKLRDELLVSRHLWERRLLSSVTDIWGFSPFASMLRVYNGVGNLLASVSLFRARNSAQMALIGALQGARWLQSRKQERETESRLERIASVGFDDARLREAQIVVAGYARSARLDPVLFGQDSLETLRDEATRVTDRFLSDAGGRIDETIDHLAIKNTGFFTRAFYETLFAAFVAFVLYRIGKNFFFDSFLHHAPPLSVDFYVTAGVVFLFWTGLLVMAFAGRLRRGLRQRIEDLASELAQSRISEGLFPRLEHACRDIEFRYARLVGMLEATADVRRQIATSPGLGFPIAPRGEPIAAPEVD